MISFVPAVGACLWASGCPEAGDGRAAGGAALQTVIMPVWGERRHCVCTPSLHLLPSGTARIRQERLLPSHSTKIKEKKRS